MGSLIAGWDGWRGYLYRLAVEPQRRRQGIAKMLLEVAERRLTAAGTARMDAMVLDGNHLGQEVRAASGFKRQPEWSRWMKPGAAG